MPDADPIQIPISIQDSATSQLNTITRAAEDATQALHRLEQAATVSFNKATGLQQQNFSNIPTLTQGYQPGQLGTAVSPQFAAQMAAIQQLQQQITTARANNQPVPPAPSNIAALTGASAALTGTIQTQQRLTQQQQQTQQAQQQTAQTQRQVQQQATHQQQAQQGQQRTRTRAAARPAYLAGAFTSLATGNTAPLGMTLATALTQAFLNIPTQAAGSRLGMRVLSGLGGSAAAAAGGGAGADAAGGGLLSGLSGVSGLVAGGLTGFVGLVAAGLYSNIQAAQQFTQEQSFRSSVAGVPGGVGFRDMVRTTGNKYMFGQQTSYDTATQLGMAGVGASAMPQALNATLAMARQSGLDPQVIARMTSALMVQGGQSAQQVTQQFADLSKASEHLRVPLNRVLDSFTSLVQATGGAAINLTSLATVQSQLGGAYNVGQMVAPAMGAEGASAIGAAAILGLSPGAFLQMQTGGKGGKGANVGALMSTISGRARQMFGGQDTTVTQMILEQLLTSSGILNLQGVNPKNASNLMSMFLSGNINSKQAQGIMASANTTDWQTQMVQIGQNESSFLDHLQQALQTISSDLGEFFRTLTPFTNAIKMLAEVVAKIYDMLFHPSGPGDPGKQIRAGIGPSPSGYYTFTGAGRGGVMRQFHPGFDVSDTRGQTDHVSPGLAAKFWTAAGGDPQTFATLMAIGARESDFTASATGAYVPGQGRAEGMMQFMPATVSFIEHAKGSPFYGTTFNPYNQEQSITAAGWYLSYLTKTQGGLTNALDYYSNDNSGAYASAVIGAANQVISGELTGTIVLTDSGGKQLGTGKATVSIPKTHVDTKPRPGHTSHGPTPPGHGGRGGHPI